MRVAWHFSAVSYDLQFRRGEIRRSRVASITGATMVGYILPVYGVSGVFAAFGCVTLIDCITCTAGAIETREKVLEELSP